MEKEMRDTFCKPCMRCLNVRAHVLVCVCLCMICAFENDKDWLVSQAQHHKLS